MPLQLSGRFAPTAKVAATLGLAGAAIGAIAVLGPGGDPYRPLQPAASAATFPSVLPSALPTVLPTTAATLPTALPTTIVTSLPTVLPTTVPTTLPTTIITTLPTVLPTTISTISPTTLPTVFPTTILPTIIPSSLPTVLPTTVIDPTTTPTTTPPTTTPTTAPTTTPATTTPATTTPATTTPATTTPATTTPATTTGTIAGGPRYLLTQLGELELGKSSVVADFNCPTGGDACYDGFVAVHVLKQNAARRIRRAGKVRIVRLVLKKPEQIALGPLRATLPGSTTTGKIPLNKRGRQLFATGQKLRIRVSIVPNIPGGQIQSNQLVTKTVTLGR